MTQITWDNTGERVYETGVDRGVLYIPDGSGVYSVGYAWNGLTTVTESPSGAESNKQYADNQVYVNLLSAEEFAATIEAFYYPIQFGQCDGTVSPVPGVSLGQQSRKSFGMAYRSLVGNDVASNDYGYKLHLIWAALAAPSEKAHTTVNDSPEAMGFSWEISTTPVQVVGYKPTAHMTIDSTQVNAGALATLESALYGSAGVDPRLPTPAEVVAMFAGTIVQSSQPVQPAYNSSTHTITIPATTGVVYQINGVTKAAGPVVITQDTVVTAKPATGYKLPAVTDDDWLITF